MKSKNVGRIAFFKYLAITAIIISILIVVSISISTNLELFFNRHLIKPFQNEIGYFTVQVILNVVLAYFIAGRNGVLIIEKNKDPFWSTFFSFIKIWVMVLIVAMFSEMLVKVVEFGITLQHFGFMVLVWVVLAGPLFLLIGAVQGIITSWFIGQEIEKNKA